MVNIMTNQEIDWDKVEQMAPLAGRIESPAKPKMNAAEKKRKLRERIEAAAKAKTVSTN